MNPREYEIRQIALGMANNNGEPSQAVVDRAKQYAEFLRGPEQGAVKQSQVGMEQFSPEDIGRIKAVDSGNSGPFRPLPPLVRPGHASETETAADVLARVAPDAA